MGRLIVHNAVTVNGAFEAPDPDKWLVLDRREQPGLDGPVLLADAMVLGRKTYEGLAAVWPTLVDDPAWGGSQSGSTHAEVRRLADPRAPLTWNATLLEGTSTPASAPSRTSTSGT